MHQQILVTFTINPQHVIAHTLFSLKRERFSSNEYREELLALRTFASELSPHWYACIASGMPDARTLLLPGGWKHLI